MMGKREIPRGSRKVKDHANKKNSYAAIKGRAAQESPETATAEGSESKETTESAEDPEKIPAEEAAARRIYDNRPGCGVSRRFREDDPEIYPAARTAGREARRRLSD